MNKYLDFFLCISLNSLHFDKQYQTEFTLDILVDLILFKFAFSEVSGVRIWNDYCIRLMSSVLIWSLEVDVVLVYVQFALVVAVDLAFVGAQQLSRFFFELRH